MFHFFERKAFYNGVKEFSLRWGGGRVTGRGMSGGTAQEVREGYNSRAQTLLVIAKGCEIQKHLFHF